MHIYIYERAASQGGAPHINAREGGRFALISRRASALSLDVVASGDPI